MRLTAIGTACLLTFVLAACKTHRAPPVGETTTTGADLPAPEPIEPRGAMVPNEVPAEPSGGAAVDLDAVDVVGRSRSDDGAKATPATPTYENSSGGSTGSVPGSSPRTDENLTGSDRKGSSFESSGGTSGLGTYGGDVPGSNRFEVKPSAGGDGGR